MRILDLLNNVGDETLLTYQGETYSSRNFADHVGSYLKQIEGDGRFKTDAFVTIEEDNPLKFYALTFALWSNGNKVLFPNRDYLDNHRAISYYKHAISFEGDNLRLRENEAFVDVDMPKDGDVIVFSSGSTGTPKGILHNKDHFIANAQSVQKRLQLSCTTSITPLKPYLVSAFSHFLVHWLSGSHLIFVDFETIRDIDQVYEKYPQASLVGSPMHVISSLQYIDSSRAPEFFFTSGDFMYPSNVEKVFDKFPRTIYYNVYGLAEVAGRFFINETKASSDKSQYDLIGENIDGTEPEVIEGQLYVGASFKYLGYVIDNEFRPSPDKHPSGDLVQRRENGLALYGRANDEIKIGGNKVSLKHIEKEISSIFKDDVCILFDTTHPSLGTLFALALQTKHKYSRRDIISSLRNELKPFEIPQMFYYIDNIPYTQTMKIDKNAIKETVDELSPIL